MEQLPSVDDFFSGDPVFLIPCRDDWFDFIDLIDEDTKGDLIES